MKDQLLHYNNCDYESVFLSRNVLEIFKPENGFFLIFNFRIHNFMKESFFIVCFKSKGWKIGFYSQAKRSLE